MDKKPRKEDDLDRDIALKARIAHRLGAKTSDIADKFSLSEEKVAEQVTEGDSERLAIDFDGEIMDPESEEQPYGYEDLDDKVSGWAIDVVENIYDNWMTLQEAVSEARPIRYAETPTSALKRKERPNSDEKSQIARILEEESCKIDGSETHAGEEFQPELPEDHSEQSPRTFITSQKYAASSEIPNLELESMAGKWFIARQDGIAAEVEIADFLKIAVNADHGDTGRRVWELLSTDGSVRHGHVTEGDDRFKTGDRVYRLESNFHAEENWNNFFEDTYSGLKEISENHRHYRVQKHGNYSIERLFHLLEKES